MPDLKATATFRGDGVTKKFYFGFDYISPEFIYVSVGGTLLQYPADYEVFDKSVELHIAPSVEELIRIYRQTPTSRIIQWADGSFVKASQMELENIQTLHLIEEATDFIVNNINATDDILNYAELARRWAESAVSPSGEEDTSSPTGRTQSSKSWANTAKQYGIDAKKMIDSSSTATIAEIMRLATEAVESIRKTKDSSLSSLNETKDTAITEINTAKTTAVNQITTKGDEYLSTMKPLAEEVSEDAKAAEYSKEDAQSAAEEAMAAAASASAFAAPAWNAEESYSYPDVVAYTDGYTYRCIGTNVIGLTPADNPDVWIIQTQKSFFDTDSKGDVMPAIIAAYDDEWELDTQGDMMPKGV